MMKLGIVFCVWFKRKREERNRVERKTREIDIFFCLDIIEIGKRD
jgi:hypothetical protein